MQSTTAESRTARFPQKRVLIIGGVAGGASCAARMRRLDEDAYIALFDRGAHVSFANCGLPYFVGNVIRDERALVVASHELFRDRFNIDVYTETEVTAIDRAAQQITVQDKRTGAVRSEKYDALVLSPGAAPIRPDLPGTSLEGVFAVRNIPDSRRIRSWIEDKHVARAVVIGGGFIGLEMAENLFRRGIAVTILEKQPQLMPSLDPEMTVPLTDHMQKQGVSLRLGDGLAAIELQGEGLCVVAESGTRLPADLVILALGVRPETTLARDCGLPVGARGGIVVNPQMRTADPCIWAVGDAVEVHDVLTGQELVLPLAGPANRQGRIAAESIAGRRTRFRGVQATAVVGVMGMTVASTGATEKGLQRAGVKDWAKIYLHPGHHASYYPGAHAIHLKLLFSCSDGRILGAQAVGHEGVEKRIDVIATAIQFAGTVQDLAEAELCYAPQYGAAKDPTNVAGMIATNVLHGDMPLAHWEDLNSAQAMDGVLLLDVREGSEYSTGHIPGAINIPLAQLRRNLDRVVGFREVWLCCGVGQRAYYALRHLAQHGIAARELSGGYATYLMLKAVRRVP